MSKENTLQPMNTLDSYREKNSRTIDIPNTDRKRNNASKDLVNFSVRA